MILRQRLRFVASGVVLALALVPALPLGHVAGEGAPEAYPAAVLRGTCDKTGDPAFPLTDVAQPEATGGVGISRTTLAAPVADLVGGGFVIGVRGEGRDAADPPLACGALTGAPTDDGVAVGLTPVGGSGYAGVALLRETGGKTDLSLYLLRTTAPTEATGAAPSTAAEPVNVTLVDFAVQADRTRFVAGTPYAFNVTNRGAAQHELVLEAGGAKDAPLETGGHEAEVEGLQPGASGTLTWTFDKPGTYQLACHMPGHFEAGMLLTIEVDPAS